MSKKSMFIYALLLVSVLLNAYFVANHFLKSSYTPNLEDQAILAEMTMMVLQNEQYQDIASRETVYAIKQGVNRFNVANPSSIFHYEIAVKTAQQTYIFTCTNSSCTDVSNEGWAYSQYSEEEPLLPLKNPTD